MFKKKLTDSSKDSVIIKGVVKLAINFLNHMIKEWETKFGAKNYKELSQKYNVFEKHFYKDLKELKNKIEKLTLKIFWLNLLLVVLLIFTIIEFIIIIQFLI